MSHSPHPDNNVCENYKNMYEPESDKKRGDDCRIFIRAKQTACEMSLLSRWCLLASISNDTPTPSCDTVRLALFPPDDAPFRARKAFIDFPRSVIAPRSDVSKLISIAVAFQNPAHVQAFVRWIYLWIVLNRIYISISRSGLRTLACAQNLISLWLTLRVSRDRARS